jgi:hypothetical protein
MIFAFAVLSTPAASGDYPRRVAIAPFASLAKEDIQQTVSVLPRLLSSRLMAIAGAEVTLIPAGDKPAAESAREAGLPVLLQGTVAKLGKGYSVDVTALDVATGKSAGAFFTAAATEDEIIPQLGAMAAEIAEKLFGVKTAARPPLPAAPPAVPVPQAPVAPPPALPAAGAAASVAAAVPPPASPSTDVSTQEWMPSSLKKAGETSKIADEIYGVVAGDRDADGTDEIIAYGKSTLYLYRVKGNEILPYTRITRPRQHHILGVETFDIDGDGKKEILVTNLVEESLESFVLKRKGDIYEEAAGKIPYHLVVLPDWMGKPVLVGQSPGIDTPYYGKIVTLSWDGKKFAAGEPLPHDTNILPLASGVTGLSSARFAKDWRLIYTDESAHLRILDSGGKSQYKSGRLYGAGIDFFEWGPYNRSEGRRKPFPLRKAVRVAPGGGEYPLVMVQETKKGVLDVTKGSYETTRLVLLHWDGNEFTEKTGTPTSDHFVSGADFLSTSVLRRGDRIAVSVIEQLGGLYKDEISRLLLYQLE